MTVDFSIIIPTRNRKDFLKVAIDSIVRQQNITYEIIVVDDASTDDTFKYIKELQKNQNVRYIRNEKCLFAHNSRREGYKIASGTYIIFMDDDDFYTDEFFFSKAKAAFTDNEKIGTVLGATTAYENDTDLFGNTTNLNALGLIEQKEYFNNFGTKYNKPLSTLTAVFKKENLDMLDLGQSKMINDTCIYLYGLLEGDVFTINSSVAAYRVHGNNISKRKFAREFIKDCLDEKRKIYCMAMERNLLCSPNDWYYNQLRSSIYYFLYTSGIDLRTTFFITMWLLKYGKGVRMKFIQGFFKN